MAFELIITPDYIREKMFNFIKPEYRGTLDMEYGDINWIFGIYDCETGLFIAHIKHFEFTNTKYILITSNGDCYFFVAHRDRHNILEIPDEIKQYSNIIESALITYNDKKVKQQFIDSFSMEEQEEYKKIEETIVDRSKRAEKIFFYEDAKNLLIKEEYNHHKIYDLYNKNTVENFKRYMPENKRRFLVGQRYRELLAQILSYGHTISKEDRNQISMLYHKAAFLSARGLDDLCEDMVLEAIKRGHEWGIYTGGYILFGEYYLEYSLKFFKDKIKGLKPLIDYINENLTIKELRSWEFYILELEKIINEKSDGFQFMLIPEGLREKMFNTLVENDMLSGPNLNWVTGVYDKASGIFLTQISSNNPSREAEYGYYNFIVIKDDGNAFIVEVSYEYKNNKYFYFMPRGYEYLIEKIKEGIERYKDDRKYRAYLSDKDMEKIKETISIMKDRIQNLEQ